MDVILDLWISAIYKDQQVRGSEIGPVAYFRNGTGSPLVNYSELSKRWGISRSSVGRLLKKLADLDYLSLLTFPGRSGTVIYLKNYLSTMFQISDVMIDKEEVAMCLNLHVSVPDTIPPESGPISDEQICVSTELPSVSKSHMLYFVRKVLQTLEAQGISCLSCPKSIFHFVTFCHFNPHFCTRFLCISSLCQVCADTNLVREKSCTYGFFNLSLLIFIIFSAQKKCAPIS